MCDTPSSSSRSSLDEPPLKIKDLIKSFEDSNSSSPPVHPPADRVEKLEKQLRHTLEQSFNDSGGVGAPLITNNNDTEDKRQDEAMLGKFETYVRTIKMITQSRQKHQQRQMFHCCMLVTLCDKVPYIKFKYPPNVSKHVLCWPF